MPNPKELSRVTSLFPGANGTNGRLFLRHLTGQIGAPPQANNGPPLRLEQQRIHLAIASVIIALGLVTFMLAILRWIRKLLVVLLVLITAVLQRGRIDGGNKLGALGDEIKYGREREREQGLAEPDIRNGK
ncbi:MAG: Adaptor for signal transduction [Watsoniomyces obsoletus]|nr:MAG: Adaptor for signal transduction [Watsoniomyces obsoletus]